MKPKRIVITSFCAALLIGGLWIWLILGFPDHFPGDPVPSISEMILRNALIVAAWPLVTAVTIQSDVSGIWIWLLFAFTGVFWGFLIETLLMVKNVSKTTSS